MSRLSRVLLLIFQGAVGKPRKLFEIGSNDKEVGLDPFYEGNMEPWGAVCVGYVKQDSPNHRLLQKLGANTAEDAELWDLHIPMAAVIDWEEEESLQIVRRNYAARLWEMLEQPPMDAEPVIFAGKSGKKWKEKEVRAWLLENAFTTINYRVAGYQGKQNPFPFDKYFGKSNTGGVGLVLVKIKDINDFGPQFRAVRYLRPHMEKLRGKIRFAVVEKTAKTLEMRRALKVGLNESLESELILFGDLEGLGDRPVGNHWHGNPHKYRLTDLSEESVNAFFEAYYAGKLPTYWASLDEDRKAPEDGELASFTFDEQVFKAPKRRGTLVAFFNDASVGCADCERGREAWRSVQKEVLLTRRLRERLRLFALDQSRNEHGEQLVPGRLAQPMAVYYPPGTSAQRKKRRRVMHKMSEHFTKEGILEVINDLLEDEDEEGEGEEEL